jgi:small subunit ribosomal protein S3
VGQKVHPRGMRLGITADWSSRWYAEREFSKYLEEDHKFRTIIKKRLRHAGISEIQIERFTKKVRVTIFSARPGIIIGHRGREVERLKKALQSITDRQLLLSVEEVRNPNLSGQLVAERIAGQLERRANYRRTLKYALKECMDSGAQGVRLAVSGRLGGVEIARYEWYHEGRVPLHTLRADIDYGFAIARTTYGVIGVKAWVFRGEVIPGTGTEAETTHQTVVREEE